MARRFESGVGRFFKYLGAFLLVSLICCIPWGVFGSSNIVWGEDNQYGRVDIPGTKVVHLPSGQIQASVALFIPGKGNETVDVPFPDNLRLVVTPAGGGAPLQVDRDYGSGANANDDRANSQRRAFQVHVPSDGDYRATTSGDFAGIGIDAQMWFGHGPPIPGTLVPFLGMGTAALLFLGWFLLRRRRRGDGDGDGDGVGDSDGFVNPAEPRTYAAMREHANSVDGLERLADLHKRGELTDDEFSAEKAKLIAGD